MSENLPLISIIIPTYNRSEYLKQCLQSILNQTYNNYEVIVCDDGSTDSTADVVDSFRNKLNIKYDYSFNSGGPACPRNRGINLANGEILAFLDSDDFWHPDKLKLSLNSFDENVDILYHDLFIYPSENIFRKKRIKTYQPKSNVFSELMYRGNCVTLSSALIRKSLLKDFDLFNTNTDYISIEDFDFWIRLSLTGAKFKKINRCLGYYNIHGDKLTKLRNRVSYEKYLFIYNKFSFLLNENDRDKSFYYTSYNLARSSFLNCNYEVSNKHLKFIISKFKLNFYTIKCIVMFLIVNKIKIFK